MLVVYCFNQLGLLKAKFCFGLISAINFGM